MIWYVLTVSNMFLFVFPPGIGYVKGACITANAFPKYSYDAAISEVGKSFKGVLVTVHELGHL